MSTVTITPVTKIIPEKCCNCGMWFGLEETFRTAQIANKGTFHCPLGHSQHYTAETNAQTIERLKREKAQQLATMDQLSAEKSALESKNTDLKSKLSKARRGARRVSKGVCPCCNRFFRNSDVCTPCGV